VQHFSAGDLLRAAVKNGNTEIEGIMKEGKLVPMETTIALLKDAMLKSDKKTFLIDGFPRALDQAHAFEKQVRCLVCLTNQCTMRSDDIDNHATRHTSIGQLAYAVHSIEILATNVH
jgi:adenylate kinase family enzyme